MDRDTVERWMQAYVKAWGTNDPEDIGALFTDDAVYYTAPHREPWRGRDGIVEGWLGRKDQPGEWKFDHQVLAIAGDLAFVQGRTDYPNDQPPVYSNLWVIRLEPEGRCSEFTEWWMGADED